MRCTDSSLVMWIHHERQTRFNLVNLFINHCALCFVLYLLLIVNINPFVEMLLIACHNSAEVFLTSFLSDTERARVQDWHRKRERDRKREREGWKIPFSTLIGTLKTTILNSHLLRVRLYSLPSTNWSFGCEAEH